MKFKDFLNETGVKYITSKKDFQKLLVGIDSSFMDNFDDNFFGDSRGLSKKRMYFAKTSQNNIDLLLNSGLYVVSNADDHTFEIEGYKFRFIRSGKTAGSKRGGDFTQQQELGSLFILKSVYENNEYDIDDIAELYPDVISNKSWQDSYTAQHKAFEKVFNDNPQFKGKLTFNRDGGFMSKITKKVKEFGFRNKDSWNPADVWVHTANAFNFLSDAATIYELNAKLKACFDSGDIMGISLKLTGKIAKIEKTNFSNAEQESYKFLNGRIPLNTKKNGYEFLNDEFSYNLAHPEGVINTQIRMYPKKAKSRVQVSYKLKGGKAEMGKVPAVIRDAIYNDYTKSVFPNGRTVPGTIKEYELIKRDYKMMISSIIKSFDTGIKSFEEFDENVINIFNNLSHSYQLIELNTKFQCIEIAYNFSRLNLNDLTGCVTKWGYAAQKKGDAYGPFIKIY